jgi:hypothetical protein
VRHDFYAVYKKNKSENNDKNIEELLLTMKMKLTTTAGGIGSTCKKTLLMFSYTSIPTNIGSAMLLPSPHETNFLSVSLYLKVHKESSRCWQ